MRSYKILLVLVSLIAVFSCKTPTDVVYFQNSQDLEKISSKNSFTPVFKVDDIVSILVSATDMDAARPFNLMQGSSLPSLESGTTATSSVSASEPTYLIDEEGAIDFPVLGKSIPNERITIIEALGLAGDMTITGKRANVMVIREDEGVNTYHRVDLTSKSIFDSPVYYLAQNDVLYIEPNTARVKSSQGNRNTVAIVLSAIGVGLSALTLFIR